MLVTYNRLGEMFPQAIVHRYVSLWVITTLLFAGLLGLAEYHRNPLNDPDQAQQRTRRPHAQRPVLQERDTLKPLPKGLSAGSSTTRNGRNSVSIIITTLSDG